MRIGVLGTGMVGRTLGSRLCELGHEVRMGARDASNPEAAAWAGSAGERASTGTFAAAAAHGEVLLNCTAGAHSIDALGSVAEEDLDGKVLIDVANPLDFSEGMPPRLTVCNGDSLGEQLQRAHPRARVVKALNTVNAEVMVDPGGTPGDHALLICGDDTDAKQTVRGLLNQLGWPDPRILDLGGITGARGTEMYLPLWVIMASALGSWKLNIAVMRPQI